MVSKPNGPEQTNALSMDANAQTPGADEHDILRALSHEMRQPLNTIIGFADMMSAEMLGPMSHPQYREYAQDIRESGQSLLDLLNDLLESRRYAALSGLDDTSHASVIQLAPDMICICEADGTVSMMNPAGLAILGMRDHSTVGIPFSAFVHPDSAALFADGFSTLMGENRRTSVKFVGEGGREIDVEMAVTPYGGGEDNGNSQILVVARDVTEKTRSMQEIAEREEFLRSIMETTVDGLITINEMGVIETANPAAERIFGARAGGMLGVNIADLVPDAKGRRQSDTDHVLQYLEVDPKDFDTGGREVTGKRRDGTTFPLEVSLSDFIIREHKHYIAVLRDITERRKAEDKLRFLATRDPLTHLPNRYLFTERLREATEATDISGQRTAVLFIDLDNFKNINDAMGHNAGDVVLQLAGKRLESCVRAVDTVARLSGDEFTVILDGVQFDGEVEAVAERMLRTLAQPFHVEGRELYTSGSIGVITYPDNCANVDELLKNVYTASHHAKEQGRNNFQFYNSHLSDNALRRLEIENGLRHALENDEFSVHYQAKVDLGTGRIIGAEALARWTNPELGSVSPVEFVPVLEETGLIVPFGDWILETACQDAVNWGTHGMADVHVAVNLSVRQFRAGHLVEKVKEVMATTGLESRRLDLELTESMLVENADETIRILEELKTTGVSISIDDFGTGYSSLSYLTKFPIDALKVDRSFVIGLPDNADAVTMAKAIVNMAQNLGLKVIAEGIETEKQSTFLQALGGNIGQGYLYSKPVPYDDFVALAGGNVMAFPAIKREGV